MSLAVQRRIDLPRGALQQPHAEAGFQLLYGVGDGRARQAEIRGRQRKAAPLHHPGEHPHPFESIHRIVRKFRIVMPEYR